MRIVDEGVKLMNYTLIQETLNFHYLFGFILPVLPLPGVNPAFQNLVKDLQPFNVSASKISVENPSNKLSDLVMVISLLNDHVSVRIGYEYFEITVFEPQQIQGSLVVVLSKIMDVLCNTFKNVPIEFGEGLTKVHWKGHLKFDQSLPEQLTNKNVLQTKDPSIQFIPSATIHTLKTTKDSSIVNSMLAIAKLEMEEKSVITELVLTYKTMNEPTYILKEFNNDLDRIMSSLGIEPGLQPQKSID